MSNWIKSPAYNQDEYHKVKYTKSTSSLSDNTVFCFKKIDSEYDANILCNKGDKKLHKAFIKKIQIISQLSIQEVRSSTRTGCGFELLDVKCLKKPLPNSVTEDVEKVNVFRFGGRKARIIGYYSGGNVFHVLFIDPFLDLYNHGS